jgi:hypothetical protein
MKASRAFPQTHVHDRKNTRMCMREGEGEDESGGEPTHTPSNLPLCFPSFLPFSVLSYVCSSLHQSLYPCIPAAQQSCIRTGSADPQLHRSEADVRAYTCSRRTCMHMHADMREVLTSTSCAYVHMPAYVHVLSRMFASTYACIYACIYLCTCSSVNEHLRKLVCMNAACTCALTPRGRMRARAHP